MPDLELAKQVSYDHKIIYKYNLYPVFDLFNFQRVGRTSEICIILYFGIVYIPG